MDVASLLPKGLSGFVRGSCLNWRHSAYTDVAAGP